MHEPPECRGRDRWKRMLQVAPAAIAAFKLLFDVVKWWQGPTG